MPGGIRVLTVGGQMPIAEHAAAVDAYRHALSTTFLAGAIIAATACLTVTLSPERSLGAMGARPLCDRMAHELATFRSMRWTGHTTATERC